MKITKTQLRQIIKEEVQKELDENFLDKVGDAMYKGKEAFKGAVGIKTDAQKKAKRIIKRRVDYLVHDMQMDGPEAEAQAAAEFKAGKLDDRGVPKDGLERSVSAGVKDDPYGAGSGRPTYASAKSDAEARRMLRARSGR
tara:strand:+ start:48 stop:467 length:420 start_codon:yes stop_codon:yes gene_type:complete